LGRVLGIDFGEKRIGVAMSDPERRLAFPREVIKYNGKLKQATRLVAAAVRDTEAEAVVVGMPLSMDGSRGQQADRVSTFVGTLRGSVGEGVEVVEWDERLSSVQAGRAMADAGVSQKNQRGKLDMVAAALILQAWLDFHASNREGTEVPV